MMIIICSLFMLFSCYFAFAADDLVYFKDLPEGHWANESVYDLVKRGVTRGFPDGTFLGDRNITRIEIACFLSNLAKSLNAVNARDEKLIAELRSEATLLRFQQEKRELETETKGYFTVRLREPVNLPHNGLLDYRLQADLIKNFSGDSNLKVSFDTLDTGFGTATSRNLLTQLAVLEGKFKMWGVDWRGSLGPGWLVHNEAAGNSPADNNTIFPLPKSELEISTQINKFTAAAAYSARQIDPSGRINVHELRGKFRYRFNNLAIELWPRYIFSNSGTRDVQAELAANYQLSDSYLTQVAVAAGNPNAGQSGWYVKLAEKISDPFKTGTNIILRLDKVGNQFRNDNLQEQDLLPLNYFNRQVLDGTCDLGVKISQRLNQDWSGVLLSDYVTTGGLKYGAAHPGTYWLWQAGVAYALTDSIVGGVNFRSYQVPSGLAQFGEAVPTLSQSTIFNLTASY